MSESINRQLHTGNLVRRGGELAAAEGRRDRAVVRASKAGMSLREIGEAVGMTHSGVAKVLERMKEENSDN